MWHEARKQEKKIRGMLVDYRRRAERRRDYYEKIVRVGAESRTRRDLSLCAVRNGVEGRVFFSPLQKKIRVLRVLFLVDPRSIAPFPAFLFCV